MLVIINSTPKKHTELDIPKGPLMEILEKHAEFNSFFEMYELVSKGFPVALRYGVSRRHQNVDLKYVINSGLAADGLENVDFSSFKESFQLSPQHGTTFYFDGGLYVGSHNSMNRNPGRRYMIKKGTPMEETVQQIFHYIRRTGGA